MTLRQQAAVIVLAPMLSVVASMAVSTLVVAPAVAGAVASEVGEAVRDTLVTPAQAKDPPAVGDPCERNDGTLGRWGYPSGHYELFCMVVASEPERMTTPAADESANQSSQNPSGQGRPPFPCADGEVGVITQQAWAQADIPWECVKASDDGDDDTLATDPADPRETSVDQHRLEFYESGTPKLITGSAAKNVEPTPAPGVTIEGLRMRWEQEKAACTNEAGIYPIDLECKGRAEAAYDAYFQALEDSVRLRS
ncbi:MAG: hypothetical protein OXG79_12460 [Chloroflexi bacterium]|nr:hypothetical protein [Chloroflexota bacterium]